MARKGKARRPKRSAQDIVFFNVRMPEHLRRDLKRVADANNHSMNQEIVSRLTKSFTAAHDTTKLIAQALFRDLDDGIINEIVNIWRRIDADDAQAEAWQEQEREREAAEAAVDRLAEEAVDLQREGGPEEEKS
jgi:Arc-like DNA binding domain